MLVKSYVVIIIRSMVRVGHSTDSRLAPVCGSPSKTSLSFGGAGSVRRGRLDRTEIGSIICGHIIDSCIEALSRSIEAVWMRRTSFERAGSGHQ